MSDKQYVIFKLDKEEYAIDINNVNEISEYVECTNVPNSPRFISGIINYRGIVVPIVHLREKIELPFSEVNESTRIIIFVMKGKQIGILVDDASKVITINDKNIEEAPSIIVDAEEKFISGIGKVENRMIIILDMENLLNEEEKNAVDRMKI